MIVLKHHNALPIWWTQAKNRHILASNLVVIGLFEVVTASHQLGCLGLLNQMLVWNAGSLSFLGWVLSSFLGHFLRYILPILRILTGRCISTFMGSASNLRACYWLVERLIVGILVNLAPVLGALRSIFCLVSKVTHLLLLPRVDVNDSLVAATHWLSLTDFDSFLHLLRRICFIHLFAV